MLFSRHLIFASFKFCNFFLNHKIREINMSRKFHIKRLVSNFGDSVCTGTNVLHIGTYKLCDASI